MLVELRVENLLLIERAELRLAEGLNVLTGETGAGKTVLAHALDLLLGGRPRGAVVRPGAEEAYVEGIFELDPAVLAALDPDLASACEAGENVGEVVLARRVRADGRTRALLNGRSAAVADLRAVGGELVSFYGQHEHRKLTVAGAQLEMLDGRCGPGHGERLRACAAAYERMRRLEERLHTLQDTKAERQRELELLDFELAEIDAVAPDPDDYRQLLGTRERLRRLDALLAGAGAAAARLLGDESSAPADDGRTSGAAAGGAQLLAEAGGALESLGGVDPQLDALAQRAGALALEAGELGSELARYCDALSAEAQEGLEEQSGALESLEERLASIERLVRKHGGSIESLAQYAQAARERRGELAEANVSSSEAQEQLAEGRAQMDELVERLRRERLSAAGPFAKAVRGQLASLAMEGASFEVALQTTAPGPTGGDAVEFLIAPNPGVPGGPLREIASGGELSRVMLAIMSVAQARQQRRTLIFDEVDAGIGGHTARAVGERLRELSRGCQVVCITHLPQIASLASRHFSIVKDVHAASTHTRVRELSPEEVLDELARMLGADGVQDGARRHARELMRAA